MSSGAKKPQTIGYWYRPIFHMLLGQGPLDAFLEFRGGDRTAWKGQQTESGRIYVDAMNLWGGEKSEGGIAGYCDIRMGERGQQPSTYLAQHFGDMQPGYEGIAAIEFRGGRYGAMNPYPKPASYKVRRIEQGWDYDDSGECWYPEKAKILMSGTVSPDVLTVDRYATFGAIGTLLAHPMSDPVPAVLPTECVIETSLTSGPDKPRLVVIGRLGQILYRSGWLGKAEDQDFLDAALDAAGREDLKSPIREVGSTLAEHVAFPPGLSGVQIQLFTVSQVGNPNMNFGMRLFVPGEDGRNWAMNPAHMILDSLVSPSMQGEPLATVNLASFAEAADRLFDEGFGLCTKYNPDAESVEDFRQRICNVIAGYCSRSRVDGLWYLDLIRDDFDKDALPVLTDDDILEFEDQVSTLDDAVNQVTVSWFDPVAKEDRMTAPVQALGAIQAAGAVNPEVLQFPEIPHLPLAQRVAARELNVKSAPLWRQDMVCNRTPYAWRKGQRFLLQAPRHGIVDMVCMVGDIDAGTLVSGAIRLTAVQDAYSMPGATYLIGQPQDDTTDDVPRGSPQQRLIELPYVELVQRMTNAELAGMTPGTGYIAGIATTPTVGRDFALYTRAEGEEYGEGTSGDWCPACTVVESAGYLDEVFTVARGTRLALLGVGQRVLWEREECRVDGFDAETGELRLKRGVADTVSQLHPPGTLLYFYDQFYAVDGREYAEGEIVTGILLTRTATRVQPPGQAVPLTVEISDRAQRPYPPARLRINESAAPEYLFGELTVTWAHRDRLLQADQLIGAEEDSIGPEPGTTYTLRAYINDVLVETQTGVTATEAVVTPSSDGDCRIELESVRDGLSSWQMQVRNFYYTGTEMHPLQLQDGTSLESQAGDPIHLMG